MQLNEIQRGDPVIFYKTKFSTHPGPRAESVTPSSHGDTYHYTVKKFWTVICRRDDQVEVATRRGKRHLIDLKDPNLRIPTWWEAFVYRNRFPDIGSVRDLSPA